MSAIVHASFTHMQNTEEDVGCPALSLSLPFPLEIRSLMNLKWLFRLGLQAIKLLEQFFALVLQFSGSIFGIAMVAVVVHAV